MWDKKRTPFDIHTKISREPGRIDPNRTGTQNICPTDAEY